MAIFFVTISQMADVITPNLILDAGEHLQESLLDPELGIKWPISIDTSDLNQISEKDSKAPTFKELRKILGMN